MNSQLETQKKYIELLIEKVNQGEMWFLEHTDHFKDVVFRYGANQINFLNNFDVSQLTIADAPTLKDRAIEALKQAIKSEWSWQGFMDMYGAITTVDEANLCQFPNNVRVTKYLEEYQAFLVSKKEFDPY
jgi:hypothetical protein